MPVFLHRHRRGLHRTARMAASLGRQEEVPGETEQDNEEKRSMEASTPSSRQSEDPWMTEDPWQGGRPQHNGYANWSETTSRTSSRASSGVGSSDSWQKVEHREWTSEHPRHVYWADEAWGHSARNSPQEEARSNWSWSSEFGGQTHEDRQSHDWRWGGWSSNRNWETDSESSYRSSHSSGSWKSARECVEPELHHGGSAGDHGSSSSLSHEQGHRAEVYAGDWRRPTSDLHQGPLRVPEAAEGSLSEAEVSAEDGLGKMTPSPMSPGAPAMKDNSFGQSLDRRRCRWKWQWPGGYWWWEDLNDISINLLCTTR